MHEGKSPLEKLRAFPLSLASGKSPLVRLSLSLFGFGLSELGLNVRKLEKSGASYGLHLFLYLYKGLHKYLNPNRRFSPAYWLL
jgi:hypothetical protein